LVAADASAELQSTQPQLHRSLTLNLSPDEQAVLQGVHHRASVLAEQAAAEATTAAAGTAVGAAPAALP
jgi:hypothetical protein